MAELLGRDFVVLKIDTERHLNGADVAARLRGERTGGIPWMVVTDAAGTELVSSDGPDGNVGCPVRPEERAWFMTMLERSVQRSGGPELAEIAAELEAFAAALR